MNQFHHKVENVLSGDDLPGLFHLADNLANNAQKHYLQLIKTDLGLLILAAVTDFLRDYYRGLESQLAVAGAILFLCSLVMTTLILLTGNDGKWFLNRVVAESVKTLAWRYMTGTNPFTQTLSNAEVDDLFSEEMNGIITSSNFNPAGLSASINGQQISDKMIKIRNSDLNTRKEFYLRDRLNEQRTWYAQKADANNRSSKRWLAAVGGIQFLGAVAAILTISGPLRQFNLVSILAAVAATFLTWLQVKQHQGLASAYGQAVVKLDILKARADHITNQDELSRFVADTENIIAREHTTWVSRRAISS